MNLDKKMAEVNEELKAIKAGVTLKQRNKKLYLRGTLPPKPGKEEKGHYQQEIALGLTASEENILKAKNDAIALSSLLKAKRFDWSLYGIKEPRPAPKKDVETIGSLVKRFEEWYLKKGLADGRRPFAVKKTLSKDYLSVFKRLLQNKQLAIDNVSDIYFRRSRIALFRA